MKASFVAALAAVASSAVAAPASGPLNGLLPTDILSGKGADATQGLGSIVSGKGSGHKILPDVAPSVHTTLTVVGQDSKHLLIQLSGPVTRLLIGLGLPELAGPVGQVVKKADKVGDLVKDLGEPVENFLTVIGHDGGALLVRISPGLTGVLAQILPGAAAPVGEVVATVGHNLKRGDANPTNHLIQDLAPQVKDVLSVAGPDAKNLLIRLSPDVSGLLAGLGLTGLAGPVGSIVRQASEVGDLLKDLGPSTEGLLIVTGKDLGALLVRLSGPVAGLVAGLGLPTISTQVGDILHVTGSRL